MTTASTFSPSPASVVLTDGTIVRTSIGLGTGIQFLDGATGAETICVALSSLVPASYEGTQGFGLAMLTLGNGDLLVIVADANGTGPTLVVQLGADGSVVSAASPFESANTSGDFTNAGFFQTLDGGYRSLGLDTSGNVQVIDISSSGTISSLSPLPNGPQQPGFGLELTDGRYISFLNDPTFSGQPTLLSEFGSDFSLISQTTMPEIPAGYTFFSAVKNGADNYAATFSSPTGDPIIGFGSLSGADADGPTRFVTLPPTTDFLPNFSTIFDIEVLPDGSYIVLWFNQSATPQDDGVRWFWAQLDATGALFMTPPTNIPVVNEQTGTFPNNTVTSTLLSITPLTDPDSSFVLSRTVTEVETDLSDPSGFVITTTVTDTVIDVVPEAIVVELTDNDDIHLGDDQNELILALDGDDFVQAGGGNDTIIGSEGRDFLTGGAGDDSIFGGAGADLLSGDAGNDTIDGGEGQDLLIVSSATTGVTIDLGILSNSNAEFVGDTLVSIEGILGSQTTGNTLIGTAADDLFIGGEESDVLVGNGGADILLGQGENDTINGLAGNDVLLTGFGDDTVITGTGVDIILFALHEAIGEGTDIINDFEIGEDLIVFYGTGFATENVSVGTAAGSTNALLSYANSSVELVGITEVDVNTNFVFVEA